MERLAIADTGSGNDLISPPDLRPVDMEHVFNGEPISLYTANGPKQVKQQVSMQVPRLDDDQDSYLLPDTPKVLTVGYRCVEEGYGFYWPPYSRRPFFTQPAENGSDPVILTEVDYVPFLVEHDVVPVDEVQPEYVHFDSDVLMPQPACPVTAPTPVPDPAGQPADEDQDEDETDSEKEDDEEDGEVAPVDAVSVAKPGSPEEAKTLSHLLTHFQRMCTAKRATCREYKDAAS